MTKLAEKFFDLFLVAETCVIRSERDFHSERF